VALGEAGDGAVVALSAAADVTEDTGTLHDLRVAKLEREKKELQQRLDFVEELVGPTEAQRKTLQEQVLAARSAAIKAKCHGASLPTKVAGRLDEPLMWASGLSERDAGLLQGGCLPNKEGILQDVSLLGDPNFQPYDEHTGAWRWDARGGVLQLSLAEVQSRFGARVAQDVVRCSRELDKYDASRRVGVELPWHFVEDRELEPSEIIDLMDQELSLRMSLRLEKVGKGHIQPVEGVVSQSSPYAVINAPPRRGRGRPAQGRASGGAVGAPRSARGRSGIAGSGASAVVPLPRVETEAGRRGLGEPRCGPIMSLGSRGSASSVDAGVA